MSRLRRNLISLATIVRREWTRMKRIAGQVFVPPVITTSLYFIIFGRLVGARIGEVESFPYALYIAPGLIMMSVIINAYGNVSSSFFSLRFQHSIDELVISPTANSVILLGYVLGGVIRGLIIAILITIVTRLFMPLELTHPLITLGFIILSASLFSLLGFTNALFARRFEEIAIVPTFILTPLTYFGGVFYSISMLPPFWQAVSKINPIVYMVNGFRYGMIGHSDINVIKAFSMLFLAVILVSLLNLSLLKRGVGTKT